MPCYYALHDTDRPGGGCNRLARSSRAHPDVLDSALLREFSYLSLLLPPFFHLFSSALMNAFFATHALQKSKCAE
jgi:hypothetical protein